MSDEASLMMRGHFMPMDVEGGPSQLAEVTIEPEATGGRPAVLIEQDGTLAFLVEGRGHALVGCSPAWLRELARTIAEAADEMERAGGHA
jgi:hypothetical protein